MSASEKSGVEKVAVVRDVYERFTAAERLNHWTVVICAVLLMLSGLAFFHPSFFWLTNMFGGGQLARAIHPWIGVVLAVSFVGMGVRFFRQNIWTADDFRWMGRLGDVIAHRDERIPEAGRFNAAQKIVFYLMFWSVLSLFVSGLMLWRLYFGDAFPIWQQQYAAAAHSVMASVMIITMIVHIYAAIWNVGSVRAMTRGPVTGGWLWKHHRKWLRRIVSEER